MPFEATDWDIFNYAKSVLRGGRRRGCRYVRDTELLWAGKHYLLIKTGPGEGRRSTKLFSREYLILSRGNPSGVAMVEVALAAIDPVHHVWRENRHRTLHNTDGTGDERWRGRRWSKRLLDELIAYAQEQDRTFLERERAEALKTQSNDAFSQRTVQLVKESGFSVDGVLEFNGVEFPVGSTYKSKIGRNDDDHFEFTSNAERTITTHVHVLDLSPEEFEIMLDALTRIHKLRLGKPLVTEATT